MGDIVGATVVEIGVEVKVGNTGAGDEVGAAVVETGVEVKVGSMGAALGVIAAVGVDVGAFVGVLVNGGATVVELDASTPIARHNDPACR